MFDELFGHGYMVRRWRRAPLYCKRISFLQSLAHRNHARGTLKVTAYYLLGVVKCLPLARGQRVTRQEIRKAARRWGRRHRIAGPAATTQSGMFHFIRVATAWFTFLGRLHNPPRMAGPFDVELADFVRWMREERGLAPGSITTLQRQVVRFLEWFARRHTALAGVTAADVDAYFRSSQCRHLSRKSIALSAYALQSFFRHTALLGRCARGLAAGIDRPPVYRHAEIPLGPTWPEVRRLIASTAGNKRTNIRARALFLLLATYGLRVGEVARLTLDDLDWDQELIHVHRSKGRRMATYPMTAQVGGALARYVRSVRHQGSHREVFLMLLAPFGPWSPNAIGSFTFRRFAQFSIQSPRRGPHALRHACAAHLLQQGATFKEIADQLGHRSLMTTGIYAKVDFNALRQVADFNLGGLA